MSRGRLALVGGGLSAAEHIETLRAWDGEVWAINGAAKWCHDNDIDATLVTVHPDIDPPACITRAVLGTECSPALFDKLAHCEIRLLPDRLPNGDGLWRGGTTALAVAYALPFMGFADMTMFGLEGSYGERSHNYDVYQNPDEAWVLVQTSSGTFRTKLEFMHQCQLMAELIWKYPIYEERSGGLLRALVQDHEHDVIDAHPDLLAEMKRQRSKHSDDPAFHHNP